MPTVTRYGLEQARIHLPAIVANAHAGIRSVITKHGKPYAAVVPHQELEALQGSTSRPAGILSLRGTGRGLWGTSTAQTVAELRNEWGER